MTDFNHVLKAAARGDSQAAAQLLPLVYDELRQLAAQKLAHEQPGQTLDATALVHEAYLRLIASQARQPTEKEEVSRGRQPSEEAEPRWQGRGHFFAAAAEAMRRILIDNARRKQRLRHGGDRQRVALPDVPAAGQSPDALLAVDDALEQLAAEDAEAAAVVKLRFYAGRSVEEAADVLGISRAQAYRHWTYARAWLRCTLSDNKR
jgi:RNA polymerase sigma factor (sigma-70 family)